MEHLELKFELKLRIQLMGSITDWTKQNRNELKIPILKHIEK